jgi:hypothetical protein
MKRCCGTGGSLLCLAFEAQTVDRKIDVVRRALGPKANKADYKLTVEIWDRVRARRQLANSFYVTINSAVVVAVWSKDSPAAGSGYVLLVGIVLALLWLLTILNYAYLSDSKSKVIRALERYSPSAPFSAEPKDPRMLPFTWIERFVRWRLS